MSFWSKLRGTSELLFQLGLAGPEWSNNSGNIEARDSTNATFVIVRGATPVAANDLATKGYVDGTAAVTWANDMAGSTNVDQWVGSISGSGGTGGTVTLSDGTNNITFTNKTNVTSTPTQLNFNGSAALIPTLAAGNQGGRIVLTAGNGSNSTSAGNANGGAGGFLNAIGGNGGTGTGTGLGGVGGAVNYTGGNGGGGGTNGNGRAGGGATFAGGTGGPGGATSGLSGNGGSVNVTGGNGAAGVTADSGVGGVANVRAGNGGNAPGINSAGGAGGVASLAGGNGGQSGTTAGNTGGVGGNIAITAGIGGAGQTTSTNGGAGGNIACTGGTGGQGIGATNGSGGTVNCAGGTGSNGAGTSTAGAGGVSSFVGGIGGNSSGTGGTAGAGGNTGLTGGTGGNGTVSGANAGAGGNATVDAGPAGTPGSGGATAAAGTVSIGTTNAVSTALGSNGVTQATFTNTSIAWRQSAVSLATTGTVTLSINNHLGVALICSGSLTGNVTVDFSGVTGWYLMDLSTVTLGANTLSLKNGTTTTNVTALIALGKTLLHVFLSGANNLSAG